MPCDALVLNGRGSTGPLAYQLACVLGCNPIVLLGYDCKYRQGKTDFWGKNRFHKPHTLKNCSRGLQWIKRVADSEEHKKEVINCSDNDVFSTRISLKEAIQKTKKKYPYTSRPYLLSRLFNLD
jgi:hypothetical protein